MKKKILIILLILILNFGSIGLSGCTTSDSGQGLTIYTSFYPIYDLTLKVVGDNAKVINLIGAGEEPHSYELTPRQMVDLENNADLIVINGLDMEHFLEEVSTTIEQKICVATDGIQALEMTTDLGTTREDPHMWLSIKNAKQMMKNIKDRLILLDSENASVYQNNYDKYAILFDGLDNEYRQAVQNFTSSTIIVSHQAFGYITNDYGLTQLALSGIDTDIEADPQTVSEIVDFINTNNVTTVFYQDSISSRVVSAIASETNATVDRLSTVESLTQKEIDAGEDYLSVMAQNLVALKRALS